MVIIFFNDPATTEIYTLSLHDALPISEDQVARLRRGDRRVDGFQVAHFADQNDVRVGEMRSEEHTSELQSQSNIVCRLLLEKKRDHLVKTRICVGLAAAVSRYVHEHGF